MRRNDLFAEEEDAECGRFLFSLLHSPPSAHGINRSSWKLDDIYRILADNAHGMSRQKIRATLKSAGFRWRKARRVLTSNDPDYNAKVAAIKEILSELKEDQAFFSIDEFGPFSIKRNGGTKRVGPGEHYVVPQYQKSKDWLILTAALELSRNQITHFYSLNKLYGGDFDGVVLCACPPVVRRRTENCSANRAGSMGGLLGDSNAGHHAFGSLPQRPAGHGHTAGLCGCESGCAAGRMALQGEVSAANFATTSVLEFRELWVHMNSSQSSLSPYSPRFLRLIRPRFN